MFLSFGRSSAIIVVGSRVRCCGLSCVGVHCPGRTTIQASHRRKPQHLPVKATTMRSSSGSCCFHAFSTAATATTVMLRQKERQYYHHPAIDDALQEQQHHQHHHSRSNNENDPKRKHSWSLEELRRESDQLLAYCRNGSGLTSNSALHYVTNTAHIFHLLEAWMEQAKAEAQSTASAAIRASMSGLEAARAARHVLLNVLDPPVLRNSSATPSDEAAKKRYRFLPQAIITSYFDVVLQAYAVCDGGKIAAEEAEALLNLMIQNSIPQAASDPTTTTISTNHNPESKPLTQQSLLSRFAPTLKTFNIVLTCWARSGAHDAGLRAQKLVEQMHHQDNEIWMDERSLVSWMDAWTHSRHPQAPEQVQSLLHQALAAGSDNGSDTTSLFRNVKLDVAVFNATINAWVQSQRSRDAAVKAENVLRLLMQWSQTCNNDEKYNNSNNVSNQVIGPNTRTYAMIVDAWAHCSSADTRYFNDSNKGNYNSQTIVADDIPSGEAAAQRAQDILERMYEHYRIGNNSEARVKPNAIVVTTAIAAWARSAPHCRHAPEQAERLWKNLYELYQESGGNDQELAPQVETGNAVLAAWARSYRTRDDSIEGTRAALRRFQSLRLVDLTSYNTVLDALSRKGRGHDAQCLLDWLEEQQQQQQQASEYHANPDSPGKIDLTPDLISYNSVLAAIARSTDGLTTIGSDAEELLRTMERLSSTDPRRASLRPDKRSYTNVMNAWARSDHPDKVQRGHALLEEMMERYRDGDTALRPDALVLAVLLKSCARTTVVALDQGNQAENRKVLLMALQTLELLETGEFGSPNDVMYASALRTVSRLTGTARQREELLGSIFVRCAKRGLVSNSVMAEMNRGGSLRLFMHLTNGENKLKREWIANVPTQHRPKL